jgi:aminoglycoside phosphotransferase (APT) family kinase protein
MPPELLDEARGIFAAHGLEPGRLVPAAGFANRVLLSDRHVLRLNDGRFAGAFGYEAGVLERLPTELPHPRVVGYGRRSNGGEYLLLTRLPGRELAAEIAVRPNGELRTLFRELGRIVAELHRLQPASWMASSWVAEAMAGRWENAYHAPPQAFPGLVAAAGLARPDAAGVLADVYHFVAERVSGASACFDDDEVGVFCHTDLHAGNVMVSGGAVTGLLDFEGSRVAAADTELDMLIRCLRGIGLDGDEPARGRALLAAFLDGYPAIAAHPRLVDRLLTYEALWHLVQCHHWRPGARWTGDPVLEVMGVLDGSLGAEYAALLAG